jgi:hypothetical protein
MLRPTAYRVGNIIYLILRHLPRQFITTDDNGSFTRLVIRPFLDYSSNDKASSLYSQLLQCRDHTGQFLMLIEQVNNQQTKLCYLIQIYRCRND